MKSNIKDSGIKICFAIFFAIIISIGNGSAQENQAEQDSIDATILRIPSSEVPAEIVILLQRLVEIEEFIQPDKKIASNDSLIRAYSNELQASKAEITEALTSMSFQRLENLIRAWKNYRNNFASMEAILKDRIDEIELVGLELNNKLTQWQKTQENIILNKYPDELKQIADTALEAINLNLQNINEKTDSLILMQRNYAKTNVLIDDVVRMLEKEQQVYQSNYLIIDSKPIWQAQDSTANLQDLKAQFRTEFDENYDMLVVYFNTNKIILLFQFIFIVLLMSGFIYLSKKWPKENLNTENKLENQVLFILRHPFFSSILIGIIFSIFIYANRPMLFVELFTILMLISLIVLLPGLLSHKIRIPIVLLFVLFLITIIQDVIPYQSLANRLVIFLQCFTALFILYQSFKIRNEFDLNPKKESLFKFLSSVFVLLIIIATISNALGGVKLAEFLIRSTIRTLSLVAITIAAVIIANSLLVLWVKSKAVESMQLQNQFNGLINNRIRPLINWIGIIFSLYVALVFFRLVKVFGDWIESIMNIEFTVASVAISIGGIISFFLIVFFTYLIVRFIKNIFKDEWVTKSKMPRGTADSLSMLLRYAIVAFGIYLSLSALGVDMNKFGFMAGALGVGIGFGLQNVVLNFIAGLILTFERPFYVGDIIEADKYMGKVTEIGVRACKILTWDGSEVIVPNGALITNNVVNWTLTNNKRRLVIPIRTAFDADPKQVIEILKKVADDHPHTHNKPAPFALFNGYGDSSLDFTMYCWVLFDVSLGTKSDIAIGAHQALSKAGISVPLPVQRTMIEEETIQQSKKNNKLK